MASRRRERSCPICCEVPREMAHTLPCRHEFCLGCILRWLQGNRGCPLCRGSISTVSFSEDDCRLSVARLARQATGQAGNAAGSRDGRGPHGPAASPASASASASQGTLSPAQPGAAGPEAVGGILPELWAELFRRRRNLLDPVRSWLRQQLQKVYKEQWWQVKTSESSILLALCMFGPDREELVQRLQPRLQHHTALLVGGVLSIIETQCSEDVRRLRGCHAAQEEAESPGASSGPSASPGDAPASGGPPGSSVGHEAGTSEEGPEASGTVPAEPEQP